jgi:hypothetical protein
MALPVLRQPVRSLPLNCAFQPAADPFSPAGAAAAKSFAGSVVRCSFRSWLVSFLTHLPDAGFIPNRRRYINE